MVGATFPPDRRLRKRREFLRIQGGSAVRARGPSFLVLGAWAIDAGALARLGVVASKKVGGAVQRNRAKRLVREAFRVLAGTLPLGVDVVVVAHPVLPSRGAVQVQAELQRQLAHLLRELERAPRPSPTSPPPAPRARGTPERTAPERPSLERATPGASDAMSPTTRGREHDGERRRPGGRR